MPSARYDEDEQNEPNEVSRQNSTEEEGVKFSINFFLS